MTESGLPTSEHLEHLDTDTIADLLENLLPATEAHRAREHVKACPDCQLTYDALLQLSEDLADEGRMDIPMPADVAEHLDAVINSEAVMRSSTVGVHSLVQIREEPRRHMPKLLGAAAAVVLIAAVGVGVVVATKDRAGENAANTNPTAILPTGVVSLSTAQIAPQVQKWLEASSGPVLNGSDAELTCAKTFASSRPNPQLRLVQPAKVDGARATVIGLQSGSPRDIEVFVLTGCDGGGGIGTSFYDTTVTLRNR
ncbi:anti-sigma factor family protein [Kribbella sp. NPDC051587]|uniref:anti-sigma factor family protein n=1 Tax=Kribbella sp. NPDC051587 TaxID=3364119 RepID=UPI0037B13EB2